MFIGTARDAADLLRPLFEDLSGERLAILHLDGRGSELHLGVEDSMSPDSAPLPLREIIGVALQLDTAALVIAHNHPSGDPTPSRADLDATGRLAGTAAALGIRLHDHLIFAGGACRSFRELGLL